MNSLKHGLRSKKLALLREESYAFEARLRKWMAIGAANDDMAEYLTYRNVCLSFDLDRVETARFQRREALIENSDEAEIAEIRELGRRLFFDPAGATPLYGNLGYNSPKRKKTSWNGEALDENDPGVLVKRIERSAQGCVWLIEQFRALREQLESIGFWQSHDRLKIIRLLECQPNQANEDRRVALVFVASQALNPVSKAGFDDLLSDMNDTQLGRYRRAVRARWPDLFRQRDNAEWRQMLLDLVDQNIERLNAMLEVHEQNADVNAERTFARLNFDPSPEGEALRNFQMKCTDRFFRGMANYRKFQGNAGGGRRETDDAERHQPRQDTSEHKGYESQARDGSEVRSNGSFRFGAGNDERLEPTADSNDVRDPAAQPPCSTDVASEISENATSEADLEEHVTSIEIQDTVEVTAGFGALSGLDNVATQPGEAAKPEQGKAQRSGSESGDPKPQTPGWSDRACSRSLPASLSKRDKRRLRREQEKRAVERMVDDKLKAGSTSFSEILASVLASPPRVSASVGPRRPRSP